MPELKAFCLNKLAPDPHVFYVLDSRTDLKPAGMEFVNPLAPSVITPGLYQRWYDRDRTGGDPAFQSGSVFQMGARVTKNMGAYWEVNLDWRSRPLSACRTA